MNFLTIGQYFNKLQSAILFLLIMPLLLFAALHVLVSEAPDDARKEYYLIMAAALLDWLAAMIIFNKKIKSVRNQQGLGAKLDKYFNLTIVRYGILTSASLLLAAGWYLSRIDLFTWLYLGGLALSAILWPSPAKVSRDLRLRGDEREMVYFKKDKF